MEVFVTGGTGVLGRSTIPLLVKDGNRVRALSRSTANEALLRELGAEPVQADLFDAAALGRALAGSEAVLHLATRIPAPADATKAANWAENDRIRTEGTRLLVDAALAAGVDTLLYPSVTLIYPDGGADWLEADTPPAPAPSVRSTLAAEAEVARFSEGGGRGLVLRMAGFYGHGSTHTDSLQAFARRGMAAVFGGSEAYIASLWIEDAARAVVAALYGAPAGLYDVADDEPLRRQDYIAALAASVGRRSLWRMPPFLARLALGAETHDMMARSQRVSNQRFKRVTGWAPLVPDARAGMAMLGGARP